MRFENTQKAYHLKSDKELYKAYYLFRMISNQTLVSFGSRLTRMALKLKLPVAPLFKATVFSQFCAGLTKEHSLELVEKLEVSKIQSCLIFAAEESKSEQGMDTCLENTLETLIFSKQKASLPFTVIKLTALGPISLFEKKGAKVPFTAKEVETWQRTLNRINTCCEKAAALGAHLLIDAEESWLQDAIDEIAESLMEKYNKETTLIYTTLQMYRKDRLNYLKNLHKKATKKGFKIGVKLVRGAYIEKENLRALELEIPSPICESKEQTDLNFNAGLDFILDHLSHCSLFLGSHNEYSVSRVLEWMEKNKVAKDHPNIWFSQLLGMADHISFNLASEGYRVVKYLPFGPVNEVIPYLIRRAEENTSVSGQTPRELSLIEKELKRRKTMAS